MRALVLLLTPVLALLYAIPASAAVGAGVRVVFVGGLGSSQPITAATFAPLGNALIASGGYAEHDLLAFSYDPRASAYSPAHTCQALSASAEHLASYLHQLRASGHADGVVLVGHSMGGVIALDTAAAFPDLTDSDHPFIRRVVTVDSPLRGLSALQRALIADLWLGECPAATDAHARYLDPSWPITLTARVDSLLNRGVRVLAVANPEDLLVPTWAQQVPGSPVNVMLRAQDEDLSHNAALTDPDAVAALVQLIGERA
jgi:pimeloyl-ACP methyl ester carboxylesterase